MTALLLSAVSRPGGKSGVALSANHLVAVELSGQHLQGRLNGTSTQAQHQVKGRLFLDVVVREGSAILKLLSGEDQTLLIRRNSFLILDLGLNVLDTVRGLNVEGDCLTS